jgi:hypothetical protein
LANICNCAVGIFAIAPCCLLESSTLWGDGMDAFLFFSNVWFAFDCAIDINTIYLLKKVLAGCDFLLEISTFAALFV